MIVNKFLLLEAAPIVDMVDHKVQASPTSWGLTECGYDIRIKENVVYKPCVYGHGPGHVFMWKEGELKGDSIRDNFILATSMELFKVPTSLMGRVLNKSTWARQGVDASLTTNIEPGWRGTLTIELVFNRNKEVFIPAGSGICQVIFEKIAVDAQYEGKYQDQISEPVEAVLSISADPKITDIFLGPIYKSEHDERGWQPK